MTKHTLSVDNLLESGTADGRRDGGEFADPARAFGCHLQSASVPIRGRLSACGRYGRLVGLLCAGIASLSGAFIAGRVSHHTELQASEAGIEEVSQSSEQANGSPLERSSAAQFVDRTVDRRIGVREQLRQLNLSGDNLLPSVCRLAQWLEQADEDDLSVALVDGESVVGKKVADTMVQLIFLRWGEIDRQGALAACRTSPTGC